VPIITRLSIIVPVYNEEKTVAQLLQRVIDLQLTQGIERQVIVVNDASRDSSDQRIREFIRNAPIDITYLAHELNQGKGAAIRSGLASVTGDFLVIQDADLELNPEDINLLLTTALTNDLDVVYGSRFLNHRVQYKLTLSLVANKFLTWLTGFLVARKITDMETCYKLVRADLIRSLYLVENRFGFEPEVTMKLLRKRRVKFGEVAITYKPRSKEEGKKIGWRDGVRAVWCLVKYRFSRR
jgi:glycosyltransferase involved in cell wall biosynthesis